MKLSHLIFVSHNEKQTLKFARDMTMKDKVLIWKDKPLVEIEIKSLTNVCQQGYRAPLTEDGTLLGVPLK